MLLRTLVVDDEPIARKGIRSFVDKLDFLEFAGFAKDVDDLIDQLNSSEVDLIFLDVEMPGISGIEFVKTYEQKLPLIIFVTAYHDYAVESYTLHAVDYLLKPVSFERFYDGARRALEITRSNRSENKEDNSFFLRHEGTFKRIDPDQVTHISALQNYTRIHGTDDSQLIVRYTLKGILELLDPEQFIMIHKSYVVNMKYVDAISGSYLSISNSGQLPIGRKYKDDVVARLLER